MRKTAIIVAALIILGLQLLRQNIRWVNNYVLHDDSFTKQNTEQSLDDNATEGICSMFSTSPNGLWKKHKADILNASYWPLRHAKNTKFTAWVDDLFNRHFQSDQIGRSLGNRPDPHEISRLLDVISNRIAYLRKDPNRENDRYAHAPALYILVTGGSVTAGVNCETNPIGLPAVYRKPNNDCAWPVRLQNLFNQVLFGGLPVVKVTNFAEGGRSSQIGKFSLEYRMFRQKENEELPHVVIWAHGANDHQEKNSTKLYYKYLPDYVEAARNLRQCDEGLPLVIMFEDSFGINGKNYGYDLINEMTGIISKLSSWYGLMSISHANVVKHQVWANYDNTTFIASMMGSRYELHYGLGFHISAAWVVLFNFLSIFVESCNERDSLTEEQNDAIALPKKYLVEYRQDEDPESLLKRWRQNTQSARMHCGHDFSDNAVCSYSWLVSDKTDVKTSADVSRVLHDVLTTNTGWKGTAQPDNPGWEAQVNNATFSLAIPVTMETNFITIISMESNGKKFIGAKLQVTVSIRGSKTVLEPNNMTAVYAVGGYHTTKTSINTPHKFKLPKKAKSGDTITVEFVLVGGAYFKIMGFALCIS